VLEGSKLAPRSRAQRARSDGISGIDGGRKVNGTDETRSGGIS